jgi:hypothetical protein
MRITVVTRPLPPTNGHFNTHRAAHLAVEVLALALHPAHSAGGPHQAELLLSLGRGFRGEGRQQ